MTRQPPIRPLYEGGEGSIMNAWERFLAGDGLPENAVRRMVEDSWRRCLERGVDPIRVAAPLSVIEDEFRTLHQRHGELVEAARPVMAQAREFLAESRTMMILTDPQGVILSVEGDPNAKDNGREVHLVPGAIWTEEVSGTNAIGTALASGNPVQICAAEHYCEGVKRWTCSASVIRDPYDGSVLGVLDISGLSGDHSMHCLALVVTGAGRIENRLAEIEMQKRARLLDVTFAHSNRWSSDGVVIFDRRGRMVRANEKAGVFLNDIGLDLGVCNDLRIPMETASLPSMRASLPKWLQPDWLEPVIDRQERLGTVLALPTRSIVSVGVRGVAATTSKASSAADAIVGDSRIMAQTKARALQLAKLRVPVLLLGPTGAGKELFAKLLHEAGPDASGSFIPLNCGCMTRDLLASELFGHAEGAFTGARRGGMAGKFEAADGGTLFLDEVGEMPIDLQAHLLRVLEDGVVYRLGENKPRNVRVRVVTATNRDLRLEVAAGRFRLDLYYRLAVTVLRLPALADRRDDIPRLVLHFLKLAAERFGVPPKQPTLQLLDALTGHAWPGNVRELRNVVDGMLLLSLGDTLTLDDLPPEVDHLETETLPPQIDTVRPDWSPRGPRLADTERAALLDAITTERGNFTNAARRLGIAKSTLYEKMKRFGIDRSSARWNRS